MRHSLQLSVSLIMLFVFAADARARDVAGLYSARVEVADRSAAELRRGAQVAFDEVMVKLTGLRVPERTKQLTPRAAEFLLQYAYAEDAESNALMLNAEFDANALVPELEGLGVPVWGKERPDTLVWLVVDAIGGREIVGGEGQTLLGDTLARRARRRGVPLLFPLVDIQATSELSTVGTWDDIVASAERLSVPYGVPAVLIGHLRQAPLGIWEARWSLLVEQERFGWQQEGDMVEFLLEDGADTLADGLARRFADPSQLGRAERMTLTIYGANSVERYARVTRYLNELDVVREVFVARVDDRVLEIEVVAQGGPAGFAESVSFGGVLTPVAGQLGAFEVSQ